MTQITFFVKDLDELTESGMSSDEMRDLLFALVQSARGEEVDTKSMSPSIRFLFVNWKGRLEAGEKASETKKKAANARWKNDEICASTCAYAEQNAVHEAVHMQGENACICTEKEAAHAPRSTTSPSTTPSTATSTREREAQSASTHSHEEQSLQTHAMDVCEERGFADYAPVFCEEMAASGWAYVNKNGNTVTVNHKNLRHVLKVFHEAWEKRKADTNAGMTKLVQAGYTPKVRSI